ncbi:AraC-like DNA-binding protein [Lipingzhangella halophila]|uniref:AraC-like DNA-binding protein n=1 Tax=Lipingzhangella halophila TaxID=1783352 RepID=A0A7W7REG3_9ACTN|nr:AraC family transcriptional regulator [Lipingzhangella halophila]MBB4930475.1 AraC-like DNA-binding protein [Lipingzhangella halophila]
MDAFADLLTGLRTEGAVLGRSALPSPCALRFVGGAPLTLCTLLDGQGWIVAGDGTRMRIRAGDSVVVRGPEPFVFTDDPADLRPDLITEVACADVADQPGSACAVDPEAPATLLVGECPLRGETGKRLLSALPPLVFAAADPDCEGAVRYLAEEVATARPGHQVVLDRLLDWLLVCTLRAWFDDPERNAPAWYRALGDPVVGTALRRMHDAPNHPWTLAALARSAGVSRATLAKRFTDLVGEPPLTYLTGWRMTLAADLLADTSMAIGDVARRTGYADGFGFSSAFKRTKGMSPTAYRAARSFSRV